MKKILSFVLCLAMMLCAFVAPASVNAVTTDVTAKGDIAKIIITTDSTITRDAYSACTISVIDEYGGTYADIIDAESSIKIRGNSTSSAYKKPYNIKFASKTNLFGMGKAKKWCLLANCYDKTLIRNAVVFDIANELGVPYTPDYHYVDVYVNGTLMGSYLLTESVEVDENRVDIDTSNNEYLLELDWNPEDEDCYYFYSYYRGSEAKLKFAINEPEKDELTQEQIDYVETLVANAENAMRNGTYEEVQKYVDIESMASFYLLLEYFRNVDVATSSTRFHIKNGKIYGGPAWDFDLSSGNYNANYYTQMYSSDGTCYKGMHATSMLWFEKLVNRFPEFQEIVNQKFIDSYYIFQNIYADNAYGTNKIDSLLNTYGASFDRNNNEAGWAPNVVHHASMQLERTPDATYEANVEYYRDWLENRTAWLVDQWDITIPEEPTFAEGDVNADGKVNIFDYMAVKAYYFGLVKFNSAQFVRGDLDVDGDIDIFDYMILKRIVLKGY